MTVVRTGNMSIMTILFSIELITTHGVSLQQTITMRSTFPPRVFT